MIIAVRICNAISEIKIYTQSRYSSEYINIRIQIHLASILIIIN